MERRNFFKGLLGAGVAVPTFINAKEVLKDPTDEIIEKLKSDLEATSQHSVKPQYFTSGCIMFPKIFKMD